MHLATALVAAAASSSSGGGGPVAGVGGSAVVGSSHSPTGGGVGPVTGAGGAISVIATSSSYIEGGQVGGILNMDNCHSPEGVALNCLQILPVLDNQDVAGRAARTVPPASAPTAAPVPSVWIWLSLVDLVGPSKRA